MMHQVTWRRNAGKQFLHVFANSVLVGMMLATRLTAQSEPVKALAFEVASVRPEERQIGQRIGTNPMRATGTRFVDRHATVQDLMEDAYAVSHYQIFGLPGWASSPDISQSTDARGRSGQRFAIEARTGGQGVPTTDQLRLMLQSLLTERFQLRIHREMRPVPVYALVIGKHGPKLKDVPGDDSVLNMSMLTYFLTSLVGRPVVDKTGLTLNYYIASELDMKKLGLEKRADLGGVATSIFGELEEKLGLKLELRKEPIEVLIVDHVEHPSPN